MIIQHFINPGISLLPDRMDTKEARIQLVAIGLQESRFQDRLQIGGPARGYWQFEEMGGVSEVLWRQSTRGFAEHVCRALRIEADMVECYHAIAYNDALACAFARLLLWPDPAPLPDVGDVDGAWDYYIRRWKPGKPHPEIWPDLYSQAIKIVERG